MDIESIVNQKAVEIEKQNFEKYNDLMQETIAFLSKCECLVYGGYAINALLPKSRQFYGPHTLPDVDVFTTNGRKLANALVGHFQKRGLSLTSYTDALHENTWKVFVNGLQVADISSVTAPVYRTLKHQSSKIGVGLTVANRAFLQLSLHMFLSQPNDAYRWPNVIERTLLFYQRFRPEAIGPLVEKRVGEGISPISVDKTHVRWWNGYIKANKFIVLGGFATTMILSQQTIFKHLKMVEKLVIGDASAWDGSPVMDVWVEGSLEPIIEQIKGECKCITHTHHAGDFFVPEHAMVFYNKQKWVCLYKSNSCLSYNTYNGFRIGTLHSLIRVYLANMLSTSPLVKFGMQSGIANLLIWIAMDQLTKMKRNLMKKPLLKELVSNCYGESHGLVTLKRERIKRMNKKK